MSTDHYAEAERLLAEVANRHFDHDDDPVVIHRWTTSRLAEAQVHATLALAAGHESR